MADSSWQAVAMLIDPIRRGLFEHVRRQHRAVTREEAAQACGVSRGLAAFHLDKLVETGLLKATYMAPAGRPRGRGRTPKVYEAHDGDLELLIPARRYELIAAILAAAVARRPTDAAEAARQQAYARGLECGRHITGRTPVPESQTGQALNRVAEALAKIGFEPSIRPDPSGARIILHNCPFHALAADEPELVCGLNHALIEGILAGMPPGARMTAELAPQPGACCVQVAPLDQAAPPPTGASDEVDCAPSPMGAASSDSRMRNGRSGV